MDAKNEAQQIHPLAAFRANRGMSQDELAVYLGVSQTLISLIESGQRSVSKRSAEEWECKTGIPRLSLLYPEQYPIHQAVFVRAAA